MFSVGIREGLNGLSFSFMMMAEQPGETAKALYFELFVCKRPVVTLP